MIIQYNQHSHRFIQLSTLFFCFIAILFTGRSVAAQDEGETAVNRRFHHYSTADGLPDNYIHDIYQDEMGFMWFATIDGLARFDGYHFELFLGGDVNDPQALANSRVMDVHPGGGGQLWLGLRSGGINRYELQSQRILRFRPEDGLGELTSGSFGAITSDEQGRMIMGGSPNIDMYIYDPADGSLSRYPKIGFENDAILDLHTDDTGAIWASFTSGVGRWDGERFRHYDLVSARSVDLWRAQNGTLWFAGGNGLSYFDSQADQIVGIANAPRGIRAIGQDQSGLFWIGADSGLHTYDSLTDRWELFAQHDPFDPTSFPAASVRSVYVDDGDNIWIGTIDGLSVVDPRQGRFSDQPADLMVSEDGGRLEVTAVTTDGDALWLGIEGELAYWAEGERTGYALPEPMTITALEVAQNGQVWFGGERADQIWSFDLDSESFISWGLAEAELAQRNSRAQSPIVTSIVEDEAGDIWVAIRWHSLQRIQPETGDTKAWIIAPGGVPDGGPPPERGEGPPPEGVGRPELELSADTIGGPINDLVLTADGLWIGYEGLGFSYMDRQAERFEHYVDNSPVGQTQDMLLDSSGILWLATERGLARFDPNVGEQIVFTNVDGLASSNIDSVMEDTAGDIWVSTRAGLSRFRQETQRFENYGLLNNLPVGDFLDNASLDIGDGRIGFGHLHGVVSFHPDDIEANPNPPQVVLTEMRLANEPVQIGEGSILSEAIEVTDLITLDHDDDFVSFEFAALAFAAPAENIYRYRLEGLEEEWNVVPADRRFATYTDLDAGTYVLQVQGTNEDGTWSVEDALLTIVVNPPWWETWWFRAVAIVLFLGLLVAGVRLRVYSLENQKGLLELEVARQTAVIQEAEIQNRRFAVLEERQRIGRELHDDIGQIIGFVSVQSQAILNWVRQGDIPKVEATAQQLMRVAQDAHTDIRQYILGIRNQGEKDTEETVGFIPGLERYLKSLEDLYGLETELRYPPGWRQNSLLVEETETQLLRIIQESLNNVRKHAGTDWANVVFSDFGETVLLVISDKGNGFEMKESISATAEQGIHEDAHFGLTIMKERAESCGGTFEIHSTPGRGTQTMVTVPKRVGEDPELAVRGLRVMLVDDHQLYLEGITNILHTRGVNVVGKANNGLEAQKMAAELQPELILMDVHMPVCNGLEATRLIKQAWPDIRIVMLTVSAEETELFDALRFGASGYLLKSTSGPEFFKMLRDAMRGESVLTPELAVKMLDQFAQNQAFGSKVKVESKPVENESVTAGSAEEASNAEPVNEQPAKPEIVLTFRQRQVLELVSQGMSNAQIADQLFISESTVKRHVSNLLGRLQLRSRYELGYYFGANYVDQDQG